MRMEISSSHVKLLRSVLAGIVCSLILPGCEAQTTSPDVSSPAVVKSASPDFAVLLTDPKYQSNVGVETNRMRCGNDKYEIIIDKNAAGFLTDITVKKNGVRISSEIDRFLTDNMTVFPTILSVRQLQCSPPDSVTLVDRLYFTFSGRRYLDLPASDAFDVFDYKFAVTGKHVRSQVTTSIGKDAIRDFSNYAATRDWNNIPGVFDLKYCVNGPPCPELEGVNE